MKERDKINNIVNNLNDSSNNEIIYALDFLNVDTFIETNPMYVN